MLKFTKHQKNVLLKTIEAMRSDPDWEWIWDDQDRKNNIRQIEVLLEAFEGSITFGTVKGHEETFSLLIQESHLADVSRRVFLDMAVRAGQAGCAPIIA